MIIDFHTHAYPDKIADKGVQYIGDFYALPMYGKGTIAHLKQVEREAALPTPLCWALLSGQT